mmetsp:Transcript_60119/g.196346  ORF Transcript_60119/g.196346 Transcript_60119/m.196346 type:complete len:235 (-) Transcript_60119:1139-1843(-)
MVLTQNETAEIVFLLLLHMVASLGDTALAEKLGLLIDAVGNHPDILAPEQPLLIKHILQRVHQPTRCSVPARINNDQGSIGLLQCPPAQIGDVLLLPQPVAVWARQVNKRQGASISQVLLQTLQGGERDLNRQAHVGPTKLLQLLRLEHAQLPASVHDVVDVLQRRCHCIDALHGLPGHEAQAGPGRLRLAGGGQGGVSLKPFRPALQQPGQLLRHREPRHGEARRVHPACYHH